MALTVLTGRANSGKTGVAYDVLSSAVERGESPTLLLPTSPDVGRAVAELSARHPVGVQIRQLDDWILELWSLHGDGRIPIESEQRLSVLGEVVAGQRLRALDAASRTPGFLRLVGSVARAAAEETREALQAARPHTPVDRELWSLLEGYSDAVRSRGLIEPARAAHRLALAPPAASEGPLVVHRFSDLSGSQEALLTSLAATREVLVTLPWEAGFPPTEALDGLVARLVASGEHRHLEARAGDSGDLARLEARLFSGGPPRPGDGAVRFCTAAGAEAEATLIAEEARAAAERFGADRVAIVFRDAAPHLERVRRALAGAGVAADMDALVPFVRTPFGGALLHLLGSVLDHDDTGAVVSFLRTPFSGADADDVDALDARWRGSPGTGLATVLGGASRLGQSCRHILKAARAVSGAGSECDNWQELADSLLGAAHDVRSLREDPEAAGDAAAHRTLLEVVSRLSSLRGGKVDIRDVVSALQEVRVPAGLSERAGHVQVTEAHRLRGRRFDAVIVAGLTAGDFSTEGRATVAAEIASRLFGTTRPSEQAAERLLFYTVCTRARRSLVLVRQSADSQGEAKRASVLWEEALDLYRAPDADASSGAEEAVIARTVRLSDLERAAPALTPGRVAARAAARGRDETPRTRAGRLADPDTLATLAARQEFSATELETYARCPYRWFYERALRPVGLDVAVDALTRGDLAHRSLARLYGDLLPRERIRRIDRETMSRALELADEAYDIEVASPETPAPADLIQRDELARVRSLVRSLVADDVAFPDGLEPAHVELRFGLSAPPDSAREDSREPGPVDLGGFLLRGSIDRVDAGRDGIVVTDYKTGATVPKRSDIERGSRIQVPLYAAAAARLLGRPVIAGLYRSLKSGSARGFYRADLMGGPLLTGTDGVSCAEAAEAIVESALETARRAVAGIRAGSIPARPTAADACDHCVAAAFCGRGD